jgi:hypothetical protein
MSTEWTAGAISMVSSLIDHYSKSGVDVSQLKSDLASMQSGVQNLRSDKYLAAGFDQATPAANYVALPKSDGAGYLYASKRWAIPFGWNSNTLPSLTSNAWIVMNQFEFNPFQYNGRLSGENYQTPAAKDISGGGGGSVDTLPKSVSVNFDSGNLKTPLKTLGISYSMDKAGTNWVSAGNATGSGKISGTATMPKGAARLSIAFQATDGSWNGACQVVPAGKICGDQSCSTVKAVSAAWSADGTGACSVK